MKYLRDKDSRRGRDQCSCGSYLSMKLLAHLWSGLGLPFFLMLFAVVSLKCSRPTVTFVTCSGGRVTLGATKSQIWQIVNPPSPVLSFCICFRSPPDFFFLDGILNSFSEFWNVYLHITRIGARLLDSATEIPGCTGWMLNAEWGLGP